MASKLPKLSANVEPEVRDAILGIATAAGQSPADVVREALNAFLLARGCPERASLTRYPAIRRTECTSRP